MPRNRTLLRGGGGGTGSGGGRASSTSKKIVIKPFRKPPALPPNYYERTTGELLQGTLAVLEHQVQRQQQKSSAMSMSMSGGTSSSGSTSSSLQNRSEILSLQHSYTAVVHLVRHQYGPMLYQDLRGSMQKAARLVLPSDSDGRGSGSGSGIGSSMVDEDERGETLRYVNAQYQVYLEYLLLCKHVFLPLDNSQPSVAAVNAAAATKQQQGQQEEGQQQSQNAAAATTILTVWQVGLEQFGARLAELGLDGVLYREWMDALLREWNSSSGSGNGSGSGNSRGTGLSLPGTGGGGGYTSSSDLQATWYLWQDLGWLPTLPLQQDLEAYWKKVSYQWKEDAGTGGGSSSTSMLTTTASTSTSASIYYRAAQFLQFAYDKHVHVTTWPWLPSLWLWSVLENCLLAPHMTSDYLLKREHLHPILLDELMHQRVKAANTILPLGVGGSPVAAASGGSRMMASPTAVAAGGTAATTLTPTQQLWMLAGRLPNGQQQVARALAEFARVQGLQKMSLMQPPSQQQQQQQLSSAASSSASSAPRKPAPAISSIGTSTQVVNELLELQDGLRRLLGTLPHGLELVHLKNTWEEVANVDTQPPLAECLAKFLDQVLKSNKRMDQYQAKFTPETWLQRIIMGLFVPIQAKDVFEAFYKRDLAKRLLLGKAVSMDIEKQVCSLLKAECGAGYTSKMEGMFQDMDWSRETMLVYKQASAAAAPTASSVDVEVQVLTTGYWPVYPQYPNLHLPDSLQEPQDRFENHYKTKYQGRRMTWTYALGQCTVRANGFQRPYDFIVGLVQALVLLQFTDAETSLTLPDLMKAVGVVDREEMERTMQSLSLAKDGTRILRKLDYDRNADENKKKKTRHAVDDKDVFKINTSFDSNKRRIQIAHIMMKETKEEREKTVETVSRDRLYLIDAVLVRIMKARKTILHQTLIPQVLEQLKVPAQPGDVKKRIESLIEREYMERDKKDRTRYNYLA